MIRRPELPAAFTERIRRQGIPKPESFLQAFDRVPATSVRRHPQKWPSAENLFHNGPELRPVAWTDNGFWLSERPSFTRDPYFHAGTYYVQEASSMFLEHVLHRLHPDTDNLLVLDACAAPGGKATLLASALPQATIVANEVIRSRVPVLIENTTKWGTGNILVTHNRLADFAPLAQRFDLVVADAPCSGEGLFRKDPDSRSVWNADLARHCSPRQRSILMDTWQALKPGGYFIYTTCTFHPDENEHNVHWLLEQTGAECLRLDFSEYTEQAQVPSTHTTAGTPGGGLPPQPRATSPAPIHQIDSGPVTAWAFYPHRTAGEGFFLSVLRKPPENNHGGKHIHSRTSGPDKPPRNERTARRIHPRTSGPSRPPLTRADSAHRSILDSWYITGDLVHYAINERLFSIRETHYRHLESVHPRLHVVYAGWHSARLAGNDVRPAPGVALSVALNKEPFFRYVLDEEQALAFLRCEPLQVPDKAWGTWFLAEFGGIPLGWLKKAGKRCNNTWPREWRIRNL